jgi:LmbE family N-acetylglucosaminyl deacetylase
MLASAGVRLRLISVTDGEASHPGPADRNALAERRTAETAEALRELGAQSAEVIRLRFPDTGLSLMNDELTAVLSDVAHGFDACLDLRAVLAALAAEERASEP